MRSVDIFCDLFLNYNGILCCDHSLELSLRDDSNEWSQHRNWLRNKKVKF